MASVAHDQETWKQQQHAAAYADDQGRYIVPSFPTFFAIFGQEHGIAYRDATQSVWFVNDVGQRTLLHNEDAAALMLFGKVDIVQQQSALDALREKR